MKKKSILLLFFIYITLINPSFTVQKEFESFEDTLSSVRYASYNLSDVDPDKKAILDVGKAIVERKKDIIDFLNFNCEKITLVNLNYLDMYAVSKGILLRSLDHKKQKLQIVDLSSSDVMESGFNVLYSALVNNGICNEWAKHKDDGENWLKGLTIILPNFNMDNVRGSIEIARKNKIYFDEKK